MLSVACRSEYFNFPTLKRGSRKFLLRYFNCTLFKLPCLKTSPKISHSSLVQQRYNMDLRVITKTMEFIAPLRLAEAWDNVGLLIEPSKPRAVSRILLTIDLTQSVLEEAINKRVELIFAYHPLLFKPVKRLANDDWKTNVALKCIEEKIAVYSSHTALDAIEGGVNDWLLKCFDVKSCVPLNIKKKEYQNWDHLIDFKAPINYHAVLSRLISDLKICDSNVSDGYVSGKIMANDDTLGIISALASNDLEFQVLSITEREAEPVVNYGIGRWVDLKSALKMQEVVDILKKHLGLQYLRLSLGRGCNVEKSLVRSIAVCAGSGADVLRGVKADLYVTGEMSHHEILNAVHNGSTVILCEHSNTERGYLSELASVLKKCLKNVEIIVSEVDKDPISIV